jgi:hypothetical protein
LIGCVPDREIEAAGDPERGKKVSEHLLEAEGCLILSGNVQMITDRYTDSALEAACTNHLRQVVIDSHNGLGDVLEKADLAVEIHLQRCAN